MDNLSEAVAKILHERRISFEPHGDHLRIPLPSGFGIMEIGELNGDDSIVGLVDHEWHTHGELLVPDYGDDTPSAIVEFLRCIISGELLMIEHQLPGEKPYRVIFEGNLDSYLKYQEPNEMLKVFEPNRSIEQGDAPDQKAVR